MHVVYIGPFHALIWHFMADGRSRLKWLWVVAIGTGEITAAFGAAPGRVRVERTPVAGGAELITWFEKLPDHGSSSGENELPILSVLNDTLLNSEQGDDRFRQVWVYTFSPPSLRQRLLGAIPFFYHRLAIRGNTGSRRPRPVFDMGIPSRGIWTHIAMAAAEAQVINPAGAVARLTTRSYNGNLGEYKTTHIWEALDVLSPMPGTEGDFNPAGLSKDQFALLQSRLELSGRIFSGLVTDKALPRFHEKYQTERAETRGHNWELLRQSAEENNLYFQPLAIGGMKDAFAMIWVDRDDLLGPPLRFNPQFLDIANPFGDERLTGWQGYVQQWDRAGRQMTMIPLALYSLDYPGVPLLLVDFRRADSPSRTEMMRRFAGDMTAGVFGLTGFGFGNLSYLSYMGLRSGWLFVHTRHGGTTNRAGRRRAFVQLRHALGSDDSLDPTLREQLAEHLRRLDIDPMERSWEQEVHGAWQQYAALLRYAEDPKGLPQTVAADRSQEARATAHGIGARGLLRAASVGTLGFYRHRDDVTLARLEKIAEQRRLALNKRTPPSPEAPAPVLPIAAGGGE
jgi:hypothetical protein